MGLFGLLNFSENGLVTNAAIALVTVLFVYRYAARKIHPKEPSVVAPRVPFVGHLIGMAMHGGKYVKNLG